MATYGDRLIYAGGMKSHMCLFDVYFGVWVGGWCKTPRTDMYPEKISISKLYENAN